MKLFATSRIAALGTVLVLGEAGRRRSARRRRGAGGARRHPKAVDDLATNLVPEVAGEIELYMPGRDPNAEASFPKFLSLAGKALVHPALKANGVEMTSLSAAQLAAERKKAEAAERAKLKKEGYTDKDSVKELIESALSSFPKGAEGEIFLRVNDPRRA